ncbi:MAG: SET domain-containing protein-lysine N-methyltransferase [Rhizobiales bacterium]|nr:SET domain-containing protein-lysine N-methyltransferase [Hyphomicrobiales bacterium]
MPTLSHSFLAPSCEVRHVEDKGGHAVYATAAITEGALLVVWSGTLVDGATLATLPRRVRSHSLQVEDDHYLVSLTDREPADYVNHSCNPNTGLSGQITLVALRDIAPGEEITYDYAMSDGSSYDEFPCGCGAAECRGRVSGEDWRRADLQARYGQHFSPYILRRIAAVPAADISPVIEVAAGAMAQAGSLVGADGYHYPPRMDEGRLMPLRARRVRRLGQPRAT